MDPYSTMMWRLLAALGSTTIAASACGGSVAEEDTTPDTKTGTNVSTGGTPSSVHCTGSCCGRPLLVEGKARVAVATNRADWLGESSERPALLPELLRDRVAQVWLDDALFEHASVASFARFSLDLLSWGAPPELLAETHRAALDEIEHARLCFSIVEHVSGEAVGPSAIDLHDVTPSGDLADVAVAAVREGCVGETLAALIAREQLARARNVVVRAALTRIADDESRHAELAWRFVAWACSTGDERVRQAVRTAFDEELRFRQFGQAVEPVNEADLDAWHAMGRLSQVELVEVEDRAKREVVSALVGQLLDAPPASVDRCAPVGLC